MNPANDSKRRVIRILRKKMLKRTESEDSICDHDPLNQGHFYISIGEDILKPIIVSGKLDPS